MFTMQVVKQNIAVQCTSCTLSDDNLQEFCENSVQTTMFWESCTGVNYTIRLAEITWTCRLIINNAKN